MYYSFFMQDSGSEYTPKQTNRREPLSGIKAKASAEHAKAAADMRAENRVRAEHLHNPPPKFTIEGHQPGATSGAKLGADTTAAIEKQRAVLKAAARTQRPTPPRPNIVSRIVSKVTGTPSTPIRATS